MRKAATRQMLIEALLSLALVGTACTPVKQRAQKTMEPVINNTNSTVTQRLETHVRMLAETLSPRDYEHTQNLDRVAAYIRQELEKAGGRTSEQPFRVDGNTYRNIIAVFGPETPQRLVVGAHYDAAGPYPGADDNASAVAGLIELADRLADTPLPLRVELVAFTLEEPPHFASERMGSAIHAASLRKEGIAVRAMISLEMIGYFSDAPNTQEYPDPSLKKIYPSQGNFIGVVGRIQEKALIQQIERVMQTTSTLPVRSLAAPASVPGIGLSDHRSYWDAGYPAVMITDTAFYRNPNYHTAQDTPETLDYVRMAQVVEQVHNVILSLAR